MARDVDCNPWAVLEARGLLLLHDAKLASVSRLVAGEPVRGSWWAHPQGGAIFRASEALDDHPDVVSVRLIAHKVTFVHRRLWPALIAVGRAREPWQLAGLAAPLRARVQALLARLDAGEELRSDAVTASGAPGPLSAASGAPGPLSAVNRTALDAIERRLLAVSRQIHTDAGRHARVLEGWDAWRRRVGAPSPRLTPERARERLELAAQTLTDGEGTVLPVLPWH